MPNEGSSTRRLWHTLFFDKSEGYLDNFSFSTCVFPEIYQKHRTRRFADISLALLDNWVKEKEMFTLLPTFSSKLLTSFLRHIIPGTLNVHKCHGPSRTTNLSELLKFDVILTTYSTLTTDFCRRSSILHQINWFRLILDESIQIYTHEASIHSKT